jgi:probable rRNA maturation factor
LTVRVERTVECLELDDRAVGAAASAALALGERPELSLQVVLVDDSTLAELHDRCLGDPSRTDVMSFDLSDPALGEYGEVYVSVDRAREVAARRGVAVARELALYVVHGTLHLCGYDDHDEHDSERMRAAEQTVLDGLGYAPDVAPHHD